MKLICIMFIQAGASLDPAHLLHMTECAAGESQAVCSIASGNMQYSYSRNEGRMCRRCSIDAP